ncbi:MAG: TIGR00341 family protein [Desulfuromonadaceae bacterium]
MPQRVIKIILPGEHEKAALELLGSQEKLIFWQEESSGSHFVASVLTDSEQSEPIMDLFEKQFSALEGFKLILFPVEASIPRLEEPDETTESTQANSNGEQKNNARISREELYADIVDSTRFSKVFVFMTILSTVVVAIGLQKNNVAVIIGAMVIAPFLGPNVALALSTNLADAKLGLNALKTFLAGIAIVLLLAVSMGYFFTTDPAIPEIAMRTRADFSDILLALASGCAGVLAFTTGLSSALIGVMVAVALLPPLTVCGLLLGTGLLKAAVGAFLLFVTNVICINLAGVMTFWFQGVSPRSWWEADRARKATRKALALWSGILFILVMIIFFWKATL